ncbi:MAG: pyridoxal phosphate-dependent aminotransferase [Nitrospinota bacterium]|nr:pyridoxal phosphate-dependent aminotransferase [Nitrospinota bacterium]
MKFSKRIQQVQPSMTLAIDAKARELRAKGEDIIGFGAGEPDFATPGNVKNAGMEAIRSNQTRYTPVAGTPELKDAIITKLKNENGLDYQANQIVVSCGGKHSFYNLAQVLWEAGDEVIIPAPYWVSFPEIVRLSGALPVIVNTTLESDFKISPVQLKEAITANTRAVLINSPSNPTGSAYSRQELDALAETALKAGLLIISDEIYEKIIFDGFSQHSIASLDKEIQRNCVVLNGVSKAYAMTGWRIGYMAAQPEIAAAVTKLQGQSTSNPCSISQSAAIEALTGPQDEVKRQAEEFQKRRDYLLERFDKIPGVSCYKPVGSFYSFPSFSGVFGKRFKEKIINGSLALTEFLLQEAKVALVPGIAFGADSHTRVSFATSKEILSKGLDRIADALDSLR